MYTSANPIPANYVVKAVGVEAVFTRTSTSAPTVNVGINSGCTEADAANVTLNSSNATLTTGVFQKNPNGNVAWTPATAAAIQTVLNHVT